MNKSLTHNKAIIPSDFGYRPSVDLTKLIVNNTIFNIYFNQVTYSYGSILVSSNLVKDYFDSYGSCDDISFYYQKTIVDYPSGDSTAVTITHGVPVKLLLYSEYDGMKLDWVRVYTAYELNTTSHNYNVIKQGYVLTYSDRVTLT